MGEWSKNIGERGEEIAGLFLDLIGWGKEQKGIDIACAHQRHRGEGGNPRKSHGVDYLYSYRSPLCDDLCDNLIISVKFKDSAYPTNSTIFRGYYADLIAAIECFSQSEDYQKQINGFKGCDKFRNFGVLFLLNNINPDADYKEVISNIDIPKTDDRYAGVYVIDNNSASFLYDAIKFVRNSEASAKISFVYIETGKYTNPASRTFSGDILPIEYLNLGILPMKAIDNTTRTSTLYLCCLSPFKEESLGRLIGLSQSLSQDWAAKTIILFSDYNELQHSNQAGRVINAFVDKGVIQKLEIGTFRPNFTTQ